MKKFTKVVVSSIVWYDNEILLLKRARNFKELTIGRGLWELPGGKVEFGLELQKALQDELTEETGAIFLNSSLKLFDILSYVINDGKTISHRINVIYNLILQQKPDIVLSEEHNDHLFTNDKYLINSLDILHPIKNRLIEIM